jgi:hypothetical protein
VGELVSNDLTEGGEGIVGHLGILFQHFQKERNLRHGQALNLVGSPAKGASEAVIGLDERGGGEVI